jgi:hypothetical protein
MGKPKLAVPLTVTQNEGLRERVLDEGQNVEIACR